MKSIILAAGYATRLYPLTENFPKPLLKVQEKTILDRIIFDIDTIDDINEHIIVSNHKFINFFNDWKLATQKKLRCPITIIDDGSTTNDNRLGAVKDISFVIEKLNINDDILVLAGDNILNFSLKSFVNFQKSKKSSCIMRHYEENIQKLQRTGVIVVDESDKVLNMEEKPSNPKSNWACPPFYIYVKKDIELITQACNKNLCNTDAPGDFIAWLCNNRSVYAFLMNGTRYDIGNLQSYQDAQFFPL